MTNEHYIDPATYQRLVETLADAAKIESFDCLDPVNAVKIALGEIGDIWPDTIKPTTHS